MASCRKSIGALASCRRSVSLEHHIFTEAGWKKALSVKHPTLRISITTDENDYKTFGYLFKPIHRRTITVVVDSGAQSCLWSRRECIESGFRITDLIPVSHNMKSANRSPISIDGAILLRLSGRTADNIIIEAAVMVYVSPDANTFYLSMEAMIQLRIVPKTFPQVGAAWIDTQHTISAVSAFRADSTAPCGCLRRTKPPTRYSELPFEPVMENVTKMKERLLTDYASSTFNQCEHQQLPSMEGPELEIHIDPNAKLVNFTTPATVPLYWQASVKKKIDMNVTMGVMEKHPYGVPTKTCHRLVCVRKHNGDPRLTVDLSPLNKHCERETYPTESPFHLARSVPPNSIKSVMDAWNGFHSLPIREEDRWLFTFITQWGVYRYCRAPQGFVSSGDGYNKRFDQITKHFLRLLRCIDDSLLHDPVADIEQHWWRVIEFLETCGNSGVVLNFEKFQFCLPTVEFAGFRISEDNVEPLPKYLNAIREYPTPTNISDIRSWFGLVNQVSHYAVLRDIMEPFRKFLSPKCTFEWTDELNELFIKSKALIISAIEEGVKIFDMFKRTCLRTDWSKTGIGFWLMQKHCSCTNQSPGCCAEGWRITLASSRFLKPAERNYAPVEGEALGVAWGLEQTKYFTMGCDNLLVVTDHSPLVKVLGDRRLDEINNPRLFRIKERTLMWRFDIEYQPGKLNSVSDALSRYPNRFAEIASLAMSSDGDREEETIVAAVGKELNNFFAVTLERVEEASRSDETIKAVVDYVMNGFPENKQNMKADTAEFWRYRGALTTINSTLWYSDRIVIPACLREKVLGNLHSAHQCVSGMTARAMVTFFWPGISHDIEQARANCRQCHINAPSQARLPPKDEPKIPKLPFEMIFSDYFKLHAFHYLIAGDRLSGWTEVVQVRPGTHSAGAKGLCTALRQLFSTFGVPVEISSDGGPEYEAHEFKGFLEKWGIKHRESSAYLPASNGRAEVGVKTTKRLLQCNIGPNGNLDTDEVVRALLQLRNTPDRDAGLSPAEILFGRPLRDAMPYIQRSTSVFENPQIHEKWRQVWQAKEEALQARYARNSAALSEHSQTLSPLQVGCKVFIQNQDKSSKHYKKWNRTGTVKEVRDFDQYYVCVDGTGRLTLRNRQFLRIRPGSDSLPSSDTTRLDGLNTQQNTASVPSKPAQRSPPQHPTAPPNPNIIDNDAQQKPSEEPAPPLNDTLQQQRFDEPLPHQDTPDTNAPHQQHLDEPSFPNDSQITSETVRNDEPVRLRRSERVKKPTQFYNAEDGTDGPANE